MGYEVAPASDGLHKDSGGLYRSRHTGV